MRALQIALLAAGTLLLSGAAYADTLAIGKPIAKTVKKVEWHKHKLRAKAGEVLILELDTGTYRGWISLSKDGTHLKSADNSPSGWRVNGPAMLAFLAPSDGVYNVDVQSWRTSYTLSARSGVLAANAPAGGSIVLDQKVSGALDWSDVRSFPRNAAADIYTFAGSQGDAIEIRMDSSEFNTLIVISGHGLSTESKDGNGYDDDHSNRLSVTLPATGEYRIEASTHATPGPEETNPTYAGKGAYVLHVVSGETAERERAEAEAKARADMGPADTHERCYYGSDYRHSDGACGFLAKGMTPADLAEAKRLDPLDFGPWLLGGQTRMAARDFAGAISDFSEAIRLNRSVANLYQYRALAYQDSNQLAAALADYTQAIQLNPSLGMAYLQRGRLHYALNRANYQAAIADYEHSRKLGFEWYGQNTQTPNAYLERANYRFNSLRDYEGAYQDYVMSSDLNSSDSAWTGQRAALDALKKAGRAEPRRPIKVRKDPKLFQPRQPKPPAAAGSAATTRQAGVLIDLIKSCPVQVLDGVDYYKVTIGQQLASGAAEPRRFDLQRLGENAVLDQLAKALDLADPVKAGLQAAAEASPGSSEDSPVRELRLCAYARRAAQLNGAILVR